MAQAGYFIIADISGYTSFIANNDLEHAHGVLSEITGLIINHLTAPLQFVELEGDAVFVFAPDHAVEDSERLIEIMEACYAAFRLRLEQMVVNTSCDCTACQAIPELDLKCVAHYGTFLPQATPNGTKLFGSDVILTHRLLKNQIIKKTGIESYALLTDAFLGKAQFGPSGLGLTQHVEEYPDFGLVSGRILNLADSVERYRQAARHRVTSEQCDVVVQTDIPAPKSLVWGFFIDPNRRMQWQDGMTNVNNEASSDGRMGVGAESHCDHGGIRMDHRVIDFYPIDYVTFHTIPSGKTIAKFFDSIFTCSLEQLPNAHCRVSLLARLNNRNLFVRLMVRLARPILRRDFAARLASLKRVLALEMASPALLP